MPLLNDIEKIYRGNSLVQKIYRGSDLIWPIATMNLLNGLKAYYRLDGNGDDALGLNNLTPTGITYGDGVINESARIDPLTTAPRLRGGSSADLSVQDSGWSCSMWVKFVNLPSQRSEWLFSRNNNPTNPSPSYRNFDVSRFGSRVYLDIYGAFESPYIEASYSVTDTEHPANTWIHFVFTYDGSKLPTGIKIYENGVLKGPLGMNTGVLTTHTQDAGSLILGNQNFYPDFGNQYSLNGSMDEVGFWNRPLNQMEVDELYNLTPYPFEEPSFNFEENLSSLWRFDGNANDTQGNSNAIGAEVTYSTGKVNDCVNLTGAFNSHIIAPYSDGFDFTDSGDDTPFTISFWVKRNNLDESAIAWRASNSEFSWNIRTEANGYGMRLFSQGTSGSLLFCGAIVNDTIGEWNHIVFTYDGSKTIEGFKAYVNRSQNYSTSIQNEYLGMAESTIDFSFGRRLEQAFGYLNGSLDEFAIWKGRVLTSSEITEIYNNGISLQ